MGTVERLKVLTLLTYADISAVNPTGHDPVARRATLAALPHGLQRADRELETERIEAVPTGSPERIAFLEGFPVRYLRTHSEAGNRRAHGARRKEPQARHGGGHPQAGFGLATDPGRADRPGLFASVAGTLSSFGMNILKAEAFSNLRSLVLDTFTFADPARTEAARTTRAAATVFILARMRCMCGGTDFP
jgi:[protein-PII] uridylyltransferase